MQVQAGMPYLWGTTCDFLLEQVPGDKTKTQGAPGNQTKAGATLEKGPSPIRVQVLEDWLRSYPRKEDARYLLEGFNYGFGIKRKAFIAQNLHSLLGMESIVQQKKNDKEVREGQWGINREVCRGICSGLGPVIGHCRIQVEKPDLFRSDGVHLSDTCLEAFLEDIRGGLLAELEGLCGGHATLLG